MIWLLFVPSSLEKNKTSTVPAGLSSSGKIQHIQVTSMYWRPLPYWKAILRFMNSQIFASRLSMFHSKQIQRPENVCWKKTKQKIQDWVREIKRTGFIHLHCSALMLSILSNFPRSYNWMRLSITQQHLRLQSTPEISFKFPALNRTLKSVQ